MPLNPTTQAENHTVLCSDNSVDSVVHRCHNTQEIGLTIW
jgi:hypothetical protein